MLRKPFVQLIKKGEQIPFDVAGTRTIHVDHRDLDSVEEAKKEMIAQIRSLENNSSELETPISVSLDLQTLRQSGNPEQRSLADVLSVISELRTTVAGLERKLGDPESILPPMYVRHLFNRFGREHEIPRKLLMEFRELINDMRLEHSREGDPRYHSAMIERLGILEHRFQRMMHDME